MRTVAIDVETAPAEAYVWSTGKQYVTLDQIKQPSYMLCFAARWNDRKRTDFYSIWDNGREGMAEAMHRILDEADAVLHYNGKRFDVPWLRTEMKLAGLTPPSPFKQIDLYQQTRQFRLDSHKLDHVLTYLLDLEGKVRHEGFGLWRDVMAGDEAARRKMRRYNIRDVDALWEAYHELLPWLKLPNANLFTDDGGRVCPTCGSSSLQSRGVERTAASTYRRFWCNPATGGCGSWSRATRRDAGVDVVGVA